MGNSEPVADKQMSSKQGWVLTLAGIASFMISLDSIVVATALTPIKVDLTASLEALGWTVNAYNLSLAGLLLTGAALGDRLGRKRLSPLAWDCSPSPLLPVRWRPLSAG